MTRKGRRLVLIAVALGVVAGAAALALYALSDNIVFFYSPSEVLHKNVQAGARMRVGGLVAPGSVVKAAGEQPELSITDGAAQVKVSYQGLPPDLFREGQGVVAEGVLEAARRAARRNDPGQARRTLHAARSGGRAEEARPLARGDATP